MQSKDKYWKNRRLVEYDWDGNIVWQYTPNGKTHHDFQRLKDGNTVFIYREEVPDEVKKKADQEKRRKATIHSDVIAEVTPDKEIVWEWHEYKYLDINNYNPMVDISDWTHTNTVQALPQNKWYDQGDKRFRPGNILVSPRSLDVIFIVDRKTKEIVWEYRGDYEGGLSGQHEPHMIEKGLPGAGNILVFDNGASPTVDVGHAGESYILEINPVTKKPVWVYDDGEKFYSKYRGTEQRFPNGNTLICEADGRRIFEVTEKGKIVWEYAVQYSSRAGRAYRYPEDYCPLTRELGDPGGRAVKPPSDVKLLPAKSPNLDQR